MLDAIVVLGCRIGAGGRPGGAAGRRLERALPLPAKSPPVARRRALVRALRERASWAIDRALWAIGGAA